MSTYAESFKNIEEFLRLGKVHEARILLGKIITPRAFSLQKRVELASLWKRAGQPVKALRVLGSPEKVSQRGNVAFWIEYADCLLKMNAVTGVRRILQNKSLESDSRYFLIKAFSFMHAWDYGKAAENLEIYLQSTKDSDYFHWVAQINLLASYTFLQKKNPSLEVAQKLAQELPARGYHRLMKNSTEILLQLSTQELTPAQEKRLSQILSNIQDFEMNESLLLEDIYYTKWRLFKKLRLGATEAVDDLKALRSQLISKPYGEVIRDIDRQLCLYEKDYTRETQICFGTPHEAFLRHFQLQVRQQPIEIEIHDGMIRLDDFSSKATLFDLQSWYAENEAQLPKKLLLAVLLDFYQPPSTVELFDRLYPDEFFDPVTSPRKINQLVFRLNQLLQTQGHGFTVQEKNQGYQIISDHPVRFSIDQSPLVLIQMTNSDLILQKIKNHFEGKFSLKDFLDCFPMPRRTAQLKLSELTKLGYLSREGRTNLTTYHVIK